MSSAAIAEYLDLWEAMADNDGAKKKIIGGANSTRK
jgi:hypothetical protein